MNWISMLWPMCASACLTVALIHLVIWFNDRTIHTHLLFTLAATAVSGIAICELQMVLAQTPEQFGRWVRWAHIPYFVAIVSVVWFVRLYFQAGRLWLAWSVCATAFLALVFNLVFLPNLEYREITSLRQVELYSGATVQIAQGTVRPWAGLGVLCSLLLLAFVVDASIALWRRGSDSDRHRAAIVGGSLSVFALAGAGHVALIHAGVISAPYMISLAFMAPVAAMVYELGLDVAMSVRLAGNLETSRAEHREGEQELNLAATAADLGMWRWDIDKDSIWMSEMGRTLFGLASLEPINIDRLLRVIHADDHPAFIHFFANSMNGNGDCECEFRVPLQDGRLRWIAGHGRVVFNGQGKPALVCGVLDITRRKYAEERFRLVVEAAPNAMVVVNSEGIITMINAQTEVVFGYTRRELIGQPIETLIPERFRSNHQGYRRDYLLAPEARPMGAGRALFGRRKDDTEVPIEIGLNPIRTSDGVLILASVVDITQRLKAELEQVRQRNELAHLSRVAMLGELSGSLAHELNQPLTAILSNAQAAQEFLAQDSTDLDEVRGILQDIVDEDRRAREVIRRLRLLFRKGEVQFEPLDLNELVREVLKLMNGELVHHGVTVKTELSPVLPKVNGDRVQVQQVLINLIVNASDAMTDNDYSDRKLCVKTLLDENGDLGMNVMDTGCGIPPESIEWVFDPFHTTKTNGMGLGLAVCRTIISAHGGKLWATSNPGRGACFHFTLASKRAGAQ